MCAGKQERFCFLDLCVQKNRRVHASPIHPPRSDGSHRDAAGRHKRRRGLGGGATGAAGVERARGGEAVDGPTELLLPAHQRNRDSSSAQHTAYQPSSDALMFRCGPGFALLCSLPGRARRGVPSELARVRLLHRTVADRHAPHLPGRGAGGGGSHCWISQLGLQSDSRPTLLSETRRLALGE